jgi:hypothetical protein
VKADVSLTGSAQLRHGSIITQSSTAAPSSPKRETSVKQERHIYAFSDADYAGLDQDWGCCKTERSNRRLEIYEAENRNVINRSRICRSQSKYQRIHLVKTFAFRTRYF